MLDKYAVRCSSSLYYSVPQVGDRFQFERLGYFASSVSIPVFIFIFKFFIYNLFV